MPLFALALTLGFATQPTVPADVLDNAYVRVTKNAAPCASGKAKECGERVIVALGSIALTGPDGKPASLTRGQILVVEAGKAHGVPTGGGFVEVAFKPTRPAVKGPAEAIAPSKNDVLYDGPRFMVFEEKLDSGDTRGKHSHAQRVVVVLNETQLWQWQYGEPEPRVLKNQVPDRLGFNEPVVHTVTNIGDQPLRNIVIEMKP